MCVRGCVVRVCVVKGCVVRGYVVRGYVVKGYVVRDCVLRGYVIRGYVVRSYVVRGLCCRGIILWLYRWSVTGNNLARLSCVFFTLVSTIPPAIASHTIIFDLLTVFFFLSYLRVIYLLFFSFSSVFSFLLSHPHPFVLLLFLILLLLFLHYLACFITSPIVDLQSFFLYSFHPLLHPRPLRLSTSLPASTSLPPTTTLTHTDLRKKMERV